MFSWLFTREVWFILKESCDDDPPDRDRTDYVKLSSRGSRISDLGVAVKAKYPNKLKSLDASDLIVYPNEDIDKQLPLKLSDELKDLGRKPDDPLIVVIPPSIKLGDTPQQYLYFTTESEIPEAVRRYDKLAERIRADEKASNYIAALCDAFSKRETDRPFHALCVPSGTGKTQLAFSLPRKEYGCIYLNMALKETSNRGLQFVYKGFAEYMVDFIKLLKKDYEERNLEEDKERQRGDDKAEERRKKNLWIYGFLAALIRLLKDNPELNLPTDLSRLRVNTLTPPGVAREAIKITSGDILKSDIRAWSEDSKGELMRQIIFFLDEFTPRDKLGQPELAYLRRSLLDLGECVIVASTDSGAVNMFNREAATECSRREASKPWVILCTQLPGYVAPPDVVSAINRCRNPGIKAVLNLCLESRPLFAEAVVEIISRYLSETRRRRSFASLVDEMRDRLFDEMQQKTTANSTEGCFGNIVAMLLAGGPLAIKDQHLMTIYAHFNNKHWAYLVNERRILVQARAASTKAAKRIRTESNRMDGKFLSIRHESPQLLPLFRVDIRREKDWLVLDNPRGDSPEFPCITFFPHPEEDFLLYLVLAGSMKEPGLFVVDVFGKRHRITAAKLSHRMLSNKPSMPLSTNAIHPDSEYHEGLVCAAFFTACNAGSITGCGLEELITRFVAELIIPIRSDYPSTLKTVDPIHWRGSGIFKANFVFPFNTLLPRDVYEVLDAAQASRPADKESVDAVTYIPRWPEDILLEPESKPYKIILEAKSTTDAKYVTRTIKDALKRQDTKAKVSFIVVDKKPPNSLRIGPNDIEWLDRDESIDDKYPLGRPVNARVFLVEVDGSKKVVLRSIDGSGDNKAAPDQLIFVISLDLIGSQFNAEPAMEEAGEAQQDESEWMDLEP